MGSTLRVKEIFYSIQGEGPFQGTPAIFIRLAGCNLSCAFCDTDFQSNISEKDTSSLIKDLTAYLPSPSKLIVITGGEPFLQDISELTLKLLTAGFDVQVETNGTIFHKDYPYELVTIVCSPKMGTVIHPLVAAHSSAMKYLVSKELGIIGRETFSPHHVCNEKVFLQPLDEGDPVKNKANTDEAVRLCLKFGFRLSLQIHKLCGLR